MQIKTPHSKLTRRTKEVSQNRVRIIHTGVVGGAISLDGSRARGYRWAASWHIPRDPFETGSRNRKERMHPNPSSRM